MNLAELDTESQEISLFILNRMAQDSVLALEIFEDGVYKVILNAILQTNLRIRLAALVALEPVCQFTQVQSAISKKVRQHHVGNQLDDDVHGGVPRVQLLTRHQHVVEHFL